MTLRHGPAVRETVNGLAERGIPTVTLISDISNTRRIAYISLDNRAAGRTAGDLVARFIGPRPAKVAMIAGSRSCRAHEEREMGSLHLFEEMFPAIKVVGLREGHDDEGRNYPRQNPTGQYPDLAGIYNIGGGSEGIAKALKEARCENQVVLVGHGLTPGNPSVAHGRNDGCGHHSEPAERDAQLCRDLRQSAGRSAAPARD